MEVDRHKLTAEESFNKKLQSAINKKKKELKVERETEKKAKYEQQLHRQMERLTNKGKRRHYRNEVKQIIKVAASEMRELDQEQIESKRKMSKI